jgi:hypothetical protein
MISLYQGTFVSLSGLLPLTQKPFKGAAIMIMSLMLFENEFLHIVSISFTSLIINELIMVALEITTW